MKYILVLFTTTALLFAGCSTDFDIAADYEEVTVVYGLLDPTQPIQYIRIQKGFLDKERGALDLALESDSIYYPDESLKVELEVVSSGLKYLLRDTILPKNAGIFATDNNRLYYFNQPIATSQKYRIIVENLNTGNIVTAETPIVKELTTTRPPNDVTSNYFINPVALDANDNPRLIQVEFKGAENGKVYELNLRFHYIEYRNGLTNPGDTTFIDWPVFRNVTTNTVTGGEGVVVDFDGRDFISYLATNLEASPTIFRKPLDKPIEYRFTVGGELLWDYIRVNTQGQTGITSLEAQPNFTNVDGGLGLFSTRTMKFRPQVALHEQTLDSLKCGYRTAPLNFVVNVPTSCN